MSSCYFLNAGTPWLPDAFRCVFAKKGITFPVLLDVPRSSKPMR